MSDNIRGTATLTLPVDHHSESVDFVMTSEGGTATLPQRGYTITIDHSLSCFMYTNDHLQLVVGMMPISVTGLRKHSNMSRNLFIIKNILSDMGLSTFLSPETDKLMRDNSGYNDCSILITYDHHIDSPLSL